MTAQQLWETTMDPTVRKMLRVEIDDAIAADETIDMCLGPDVAPRKRWIQTHAGEVQTSTRWGSVRVAVDAMGGDNAPRVTVAGAVAAARGGVAVTLVGREAEVRAQLATFADAAAAHRGRRRPGRGGDARAPRQRRAPEAGLLDRRRHRPAGRGEGQTPSTPPATAGP